MNFLLNPAPTASPVASRCDWKWRQASVLTLNLHRNLNLPVGIKAAGIPEQIKSKMKIMIKTETNLPATLSHTSRGLDLAGARLKDAFGMRPATALRNQPGSGCSRGAGRLPISIHRNGGTL